MAIQNFIAGGFYGKLGSTVGQRWKNKRTLRTYVIPHNPRTIIQQANRNAFGSAVPLAQLGMSTNWHSPVWSVDRKTEWSHRMSFAKRNLDIGKSHFNSVPLAPETFIANYQIYTSEVVSIEAPRTVRVKITGTYPKTAKHYGAVVLIKTGEREGEMFVMQGTFDTDTDDIIIFEAENIENIEGETLEMKIISNDDVVIDTVVASANMQPRMPVPTYFNPDLVFYATSTLREEYIDFYFVSTNDWSDNQSGSVIYRSNVRFSNLIPKIPNSNPPAGTMQNGDTQGYNIDGKWGVNVTRHSENIWKYYKEGDVQITINITYTNFKLGDLRPYTGQEVQTFSIHWVSNLPAVEISDLKNNFVANLQSADKDTVYTGEILSRGGLTPVLFQNVKITVPFNNMQFFKNGSLVATYPNDPQGSNIWNFEPEINSTQIEYLAPEHLVTADWKRKGKNTSYRYTGDVYLSPQDTSYPAYVLFLDKNPLIINEPTTVEGANINTLYEGAEIFNPELTYVSVNTTAANRIVVTFSTQNEYNWNIVGTRNNNTSISVRNMSKKINDPSFPSADVEYCFFNTKNVDGKLYYELQIEAPNIAKYYSSGNLDISIDLQYENYTVGDYEPYSGNYKKDVGIWWINNQTPNTKNDFNKLIYMEGSYESDDPTFTFNMYQHDTTNRFWCENIEMEIVKDGMTFQPWSGSGATYPNTAGITNLWNWSGIITVTEYGKDGTMTFSIPSKSGEYLSYGNIIIRQKTSGVVGKIWNGTGNPLEITEPTTVKLDRFEVSYDIIE